jgi:hypothetical protein
VNIKKKALRKQAGKIIIPSIKITPTHHKKPKKSDKNTFLGKKIDEVLKTVQNRSEFSKNTDFRQIPDNIHTNAETFLIIATIFINIELQGMFAVLYAMTYSVRLRISESTGLIIPLSGV